MYKNDSDSLLNVTDIYGIKLLLTRLHREHKPRHNSKDTINNLLSYCSLRIQSTFNFCGAGKISSLKEPIPRIISLNLIHS